jgi:hypothetical protein
VLNHEFFSELPTFPDMTARDQPEASGVSGALNWSNHPN